MFFVFLSLLLNRAGASADGGVEATPGEEGLKEGEAGEEDEDRTPGCGDGEGQETNTDKQAQETIGSADVAASFAD